MRHKWKQWWLWIGFGDRNYMGLMVILKSENSTFALEFHHISHLLCLNLANQQFVGGLTCQPYCCQREVVVQVMQDKGFATFACMHRVHLFAICAGTNILCFSTAGMLRRASMYSWSYDVVRGVVHSHLSKIGLSLFTFADGHAALMSMLRHINAISTSTMLILLSEPSKTKRRGRAIT